MLADTVVDTAALLADLLTALGLPEPPPGEVTITGRDPIWGARYPVGEAAAVVLSAIGVAVNDLWERRTGRRQQVRADVRHAAASLRGHSFQLLNGEETPRRGVTGAGLLGPVSLQGRPLDPATWRVAAPWARGPAR